MAKQKAKLPFNNKIVLEHRSKWDENGPQLYCLEVNKLWDVSGTGRNRPQTTDKKEKQTKK